MGTITCPHCEREIDLAWAVCPSCCAELEHVDTIAELEIYHCPDCSVLVYVMGAEKQLAGLVPTWLQGFEKEAGYESSHKR